VDGERVQQVGFAAGIGAVAGAAVGAGRAPVRAAVLGAAGMAAVEAAARSVQRPDEIPPLWSRIAASGALAAPLGWLAGRLGARPGAVAVGAGAVAGALGVRPQKVALGPVVGAAAGRLLGGRVNTATLAAATVVGFRLVSAAAFRDAQVRLLATAVPADQLPFVVPLEARTRYVGTGYVRELASVLGGTYTAANPDVGIVADLDDLAGRTSTRAAPTRWCASSTSTPPGSRWTSCRSGGCGYAPATCSTARWSPARSARPTCRRTRRRPCAAYAAGSTPSPTRPVTITVRGWIRSTRGHRRADLRRDLHDVPARGPRVRQRRLPGPAGRLHRDPAPVGRPDGGLTLTSRSDLPHPGHYLAYIDPQTRDLTAVEVPGFAEQLDVWADGDELRAEHAFSVFGFPFLVLHYTIRRKP
jgi:hypothetical protein